MTRLKRLYHLVLLATCTIPIVAFASRETSRENADGKSSASLSISPAGDTQNQPAGQGFALSCMGGLGEGDYTEFRWTGPQGQDISTNANRAIHVFSTDNGGIILNFDQPSPENSGTYSCIAKYANTEELKREVKMIFFHDITFEDCPKEQTLILGKEGSLRCHVHGNPVPRVRWFAEPHINHLQNDERHMLTGTGVTIRNVQLSDGGEYIVNAMVTATGKFQKRKIMVTVMVPPRVVDLAERQKITEGLPATIHCGTQGVPPALCYWTDHRSRNLSDISSFRVTPETCNLDFLMANREHEGEYICHARNPAGIASQTTLIDVVIPPKILEFTNRTGDEEGSAQIECRAQGKPIPEMYIRKEGSPLPLSGADDSLIQIADTLNGPEKTLIAKISNLNRDRSGLYYCSAENEYSKVEMVAKLDVNFRPVLMAKENPVWTWASKSAVLTCYVEAIPNATVEWRDHHSRTIIPGNDGNGMYHIDASNGASTLVVRDGIGDKYGEYYCVSGNNLGERVIAIDVREALRPEKPRIPEVLRVTPTTVTIEFNHPIRDGGMPILEYFVKYWADGQENEQEAEVRTYNEVFGKPITITRLLPRVKYNFRFSARSEVGEGVQSDILRIETTKETKPDRPVLLTKQDLDVDPSKFSIEWLMPLDNGAPIDYFEGVYYPIKMISPDAYEPVRGGKNFVVNKWATTVVADLVDMKPSTHYRVTVQAHNMLGSSDPADLIFRTGEYRGMIRAYPTSDEDAINVNGTAIRLPIIIGLAILLSFVILIVLDVFCYFRFQWGLLFFLRHFLCSKKHQYSKTNQQQQQPQSPA